MGRGGMALLLMGFAAAIGMGCREERRGSAAERSPRYEQAVGPVDGTGARGVPEKSHYERGARELPVICRLRMRSKTIVIKSGPDGPLYSASADDGTILAHELPPERLKILHPDLYHLIHNLTADTERAPPSPRVLEEMEDELLRHLKDESRPSTTPRPVFPSKNSLFRMMPTPRVRP